MRVGILAGAFNPPTVAHLALARAASANHVDEVVFVLPQSFPHKGYEFADFAERVDMLRKAIGKEPDFAIALSQAGLFRDIAQEFRDVYGPGVRLTFLCGRDAAERILGWNYGDGTNPAEMLRHFDLLVASRRGELETPLHLQHAVKRLKLDCDVAEVSSTSVRERIAKGEAWRHLIPPPIQETVAVLYAPKT